MLQQLNRSQYEQWSQIAGRLKIPRRTTTRNSSKEMSCAIDSRRSETRGRTFIASKQRIHSNELAFSQFLAQQTEMWVSHKHRWHKQLNRANGFQPGVRNTSSGIYPAGRAVGKLTQTIDSAGNFRSRNAQSEIGRQVYHFGLTSLQATKSKSESGR